MLKLHHPCKLALLWLAGISMSACHSNAVFMAQTDVPSVSILTPDSFAYNRQWQSGLWIVGDDTISVELKGRGHSTFNQPKHPYAVRFPRKWALPSMEKHKHWVLLANFFDHSLMRNALAMEVAKQTSLKDITPEGRFISLTTNGKWQGVYWMSERVKDKVAEGDSLLKLDAYHWQEQNARHMPTDSLPHSIPADTLSLVDWWLVHELCMNAEPNGPRSCYFRITPSGSLQAGPAWDFDMAFNEVGVDNGGDLRPTKFKGTTALPPFLKGKTICWLTADSLYLSNCALLRSLCQDRRFLEVAQKRWRKLRPKMKHIASLIPAYAHLLQEQGPADQSLWNTKEPARFDNSSTWSEAVSKLQSTFKRRLKSMGKLLNERVKGCDKIQHKSPAHKSTADGLK